VVEFRPHVPKLRQAGINVAIIGSGNPNFARGFQQALETGDIALYCDEARAGYKELGLVRNMAANFRPDVILKGAALFAKGLRQKRTMGDAAQQAGLAIVLPDGTVAYKFISQHPADQPKVEEYVAEALKHPRA
jgi:hypothetical protein